MTECLYCAKLVERASYHVCDPDDRYRAEMGKDPPEPREDDPLAWQWEYRGSKKERERLAAMLGKEAK